VVLQVFMVSLGLRVAKVLKDLRGLKRSNVMNTQTALTFCVDKQRRKTSCRTQYLQSPPPSPTVAMDTSNCPFDEV